MPGRGHQCQVALSCPIYLLLNQLAAVANRSLAKNLLVAGIEIDDPFPPERLHSVPIQHHPAPAAMFRTWTSRCWIKAHPSITREVGLDPGMGIAGANQILGREVIELTRAKSIYNARRNLQCAQHDCHRGRKIFTVSLFAFKKKIG